MPDLREEWLVDYHVEWAKCIYFEIQICQYHDEWNWLFVDCCDVEVIDVPPTCRYELSVSDSGWRIRLDSKRLLYLPTSPVFSCSTVPVYTRTIEMINGVSKWFSGQRARWWIWLVSLQLIRTVTRIIRSVMFNLIVIVAAFLFFFRPAFQKTWRKLICTTLFDLPAMIQCFFWKLFIAHKNLIGDPELFS